MNSDIFLTVSDLCVTFPMKNGEIIAINKINFTVKKNEFVCIIGPSGSGKSTLMRVLAGILEPDSGTVEYVKEDPVRALVFQNSNLLPWLNVEKNIALPLLVKRVPEEEALRAAREWIGKMRLSGFEKEWPKNLSGGMAQRVAIARALIQKPELLLLDEPLGALDALTREQVGEELLNTWENNRTAVIMITHSIAEAVLFSDRIFVFSDRPGSINAEIENDCPRPRNADLRYQPKFIEKTRQLRTLLGAGKRV